MLKIENTEVMGWEAAIRGMRNPMNSWGMSDSCWIADNDGRYTGKFEIGTNDLDLMKKLRNAGTDHRKFMRMITVYCDITAPLYWWKEFDTYKVGTVANSCSTMHKIADKDFTLEDFSCEHLIGVDSMPDDALISGKYPFVDVTPYKDKGIVYSPLGLLNITIAMLNECRMKYLTALKTEPETGLSAKDIWWQMIQLLPSSYNQRRTVMLNYEVLANIYKSRRNHKLDEWHTFCDLVESLPYSELITGVNRMDVQRVDSPKIKFTDEDRTYLCSLVDHFNAIGNLNPVSPEDLKQALNEKGELT